MSQSVNIYLKNIFGKGFSIERTDTKSKSILLNKFTFSEILSIMLPEISETAVRLILKEVVNRGSKIIKCDTTILNGPGIWGTLDPDDDTDDEDDGTIDSNKPFKLQGKAFFKGVHGEYFLLTVDDDGSQRWIRDDPNKYLNVFIFEQPTYPLPPQEGI